MRIISGTLKGRSIKFLKNLNTRPLRDSVKENIFNFLNHSNLIQVKIDNSNILDLYSGIGSFGIECISRGARKVTFIEQDPGATEILKENLVKLSIINKSKIYTNKIENIISKDLAEKYSIFFFYSSFADFDFLKNLLIIKRKKIFEKNHVVAIHREAKSKDELRDVLKIIQIKKYGRSKIIFGILN